MKALMYVWFLLMSSGISAQQLSEESRILEKDHPEVFLAIKEYASSKWKNDSGNIIYEINDQAKAFGEVCQLVIKDFSRNRFYFEAIKQGTEDGKSFSFIEPAINWKEVLLDLKPEAGIKSPY